MYKILWAVFLTGCVYIGGDSNGDVDQSVNPEPEKIINVPQENLLDILRK